MANRNWPLKFDGDSTELPFVSNGMFDFSNAYTTVPGWVLELAMRRLHMPEELIDVMVGLVEGQRLAVRTAAGYTRCFGVEGGLPQGDPCSRQTGGPLAGGVKVTRAKVLRRAQGRRQP